MDISPQRTHAVVGGKEILKTIRVSPDHSSEEFNIRNAIISYASTHNVTGALNARYKEQLTVRDVKWSHGAYDTVIATAVANGPVVTYDLNRAGLELSRFQGHSRQVHRLAFNPHFPAYLLSGSQDATIRMWDLRMPPTERGAMTSGCQKMFNGNSDAIRDIRWSPTDGVMFATATDSGAIQLWDDRKTAAPLLRIAAHDKPCFAVDWHPDGKYLISGGTDKLVKVWDFSSTAERRQKPTFQFRTPQGVLNVRWRPPCWSGQLQGVGDWQSTQAVTSYDKGDPRIHLWDLQRPHIPFREFDRYDSLAADLLWHSNDLLWTVGEAGAFTQSDVRYAPQIINQRPMCSVAWSPSGDVLAFVQKRPRRALGIHPTEFLGYGDESSNNGEKALGQSPKDEVLDETLFTSTTSVRQRKSRSSKSLGSTPPSTADTMPVLPLDRSLSKNGNPDPSQLGVIGTVPGATVDSSLFRYLARHYSPLIEDPNDKQSDEDRLISLLDSFDDNAECAESVSLFRLSQTWRVAKFALVQDLRRRAREQRELNQSGNGKVRKRLSNEGPLAERSRHVEEGKHDKVKSRLFKGVMEAEGQRTLVPEVDTTSNMTTPLARPLPDSPRLNSLETTDYTADSLDDGAGIQALPPSVLSSNSNDLSFSSVDRRQLGHRPSESSEDGFVHAGVSVSDRMSQLGPPSLPTDQRSAPRAIAGRADWRVLNRRDFPKVASDEYEQKLEDKRAALRDYKQLPKKVLSLEPSMQPTKPPIPGHFPRQESSESFPMFSASTDSSHPTKSVGASFSPKPVAMLADSDPSSSAEVLNAEGTSPSDRGALPDEDDSLKSFSFEESPSGTNDIHLQRPSSPLALFSEPHLEVSGNGATPTVIGSSKLLISGGKDDISAVSIPMTLDLTEDKPWSVEVLLREAIRHYRNSTPLDIQSAAHLLQKLHILFRQHEIILPYEECALIFQTYNEQLLRQSMFVEAAELRLFCVPSYPAVYEYAQVDSYINVFCFTCRRPYENPKRDNTRCYRCGTAQQSCSICMSIDPPPEWVAAQSSAWDDSSSKTNPSSPLSSSSSSPSVSATEVIPASETVPRPRGSALWTWCQGCGHGGHLVCMTTWLSDPSISEGGCATAGCMHDCGPGPRRDHNRTMLQEEAKRRDSASRKAGIGFVKRDPWARGESRAVEKVRGMLGRVSSAGGSASTSASTGGHGHGTGALSSGMMSPKKVRLVTPSEQGIRRSGPVRTPVNGAGGRDREPHSDPANSKRIL